MTSIIRKFITRQSNKEVNNGSRKQVTQDDSNVEEVERRSQEAGRQDGPSEGSQGRLGRSEEGSTDSTQGGQEGNDLQGSSGEEGSVLTCGRPGCVHDEHAGRLIPGTENETATHKIGLYAWPDLTHAMAVIAKAPVKPGDMSAFRFVTPEAYAKMGFEDVKPRAFGIFQDGVVAPRFRGQQETCQCGVNHHPSEHSAMITKETIGTADQLDIESRQRMVKRLHPWGTDPTCSDCVAP
jgi:hypothetical protein